MINDTRGGLIRFLVISLPNIERLTEAIKTAINHHQCTVQILILDETARDTIKHRELSLLPIKAQIRDDIVENKNELNTIRRKLDKDKVDRLQCYYYKEWVSVSMYVCHDDLLFGHYFLSKKGTESQYFRVHGKDTKLFKEFEEHFDEIWKRSAKEGNDVFRQ